MSRHQSPLSDGETWSTDPFALVEKDGFFYGRGTIDIKNEVAVLSADLIRLKQEHNRPDRDIIPLSTPNCGQRAR
jgi:acetylornithine deacetylase/succinyl-diaminopimelate desuccinylase-like protein